ncbi:MAG: type II toxin-antitoxin system ParD family antitoxin [Sphaerospermopsis kisseleviana]
MTTVNISLPDSMRDFINEQVEKGGLIRQDLEKVQQSRIEKLLLEGLDSGEGIEITDEWWEKKRSQLIEKIRQS